MVADHEFEVVFIRNLRCVPVSPIIQKDSLTFLLGIIWKSEVYETEPTSIDELKDSIGPEYRSNSHQKFLNVILELEKMFYSFTVNRKNHFLDITRLF